MKKDFNIEKYTPQNIYPSRKDFYKDVQENVLRETLLINEDSSPKQYAIRPYLKIAIAASVVMLYGVLFVWLSYDNKAEEVLLVNQKEQTFSNSSENLINAQPNEVQISADINDVNEQLIANSQHKIGNNDVITPPEISKLEEIKLPEEEVTKCDLPTPQSAMNEHRSKDVNAEIIELDDISNEELAELTQNMENDIYLELYN